MKKPPKQLAKKDGEESISQLRRELQEAQLLAEVHHKIIEITEKEFKIKIAKKTSIINRSLHFSTYTFFRIVSI